MRKKKPALKLADGERVGSVEDQAVQVGLNHLEVRRIPSSADFDIDFEHGEILIGDNVPTARILWLGATLAFGLLGAADACPLKLVDAEPHLPRMRYQGRDVRQAVQAPAGPSRRISPWI